MVRNKDRTSKAKQFRRSKPMSHTLLKALAEEALKGNKPSSTFKPESFIRVVAEINQTFGIECLSGHVENHLKTMKRSGLPFQLRAKSGFGWDDNLKMVTVNKHVYDKEVMAHPNHEKYLTKKIEIYEEMAIVVGKTLQLDIFPNPFVDIQCDINTEEDSTPPDDDVEFEEAAKKKETSSTTIPSSQKRSHKERKCDLKENGIKKMDIY
ncbi:hypothetical protein GH714_037606 [Hevea brasiliensis]|uniref:Myb/SANT-like domain-containing protein n=1 Tax=Hevea brasiliensis TaxID=3981 RepID=A0A6A6K9F2_HEVBR|nr:hypothetical protein GH714_037606 [Hevea brasiliensis]